MNKIISTLLCLPLLCIAFCLSSCEDELLEKTNPNALTDGAFWKTNDDFDMATNAMYGSLQLPAVRGVESAWFIMRTDLAGTESWYYRGFANFKFSDATSQVEQRWSEYYVGVFRANQIIYYLEQANDLTEAQKTSYMAQARFMRGLEYFWLGTDFNQAIIHDVLPMPGDDMHKPLSSRDDVYAFALEDLKFAQANLPTTWSTSDLGRFTWGAATAIMGKLYLYQNDYVNAKACFKEVIDSKLYGLCDNYMDNFTTDNEYNEESILEISFSDNYKEGAKGNTHDEVNGSEATSIAQNFATLQAGGYNCCLPTYWCIETYLYADQMDVTKSMNIGFTHSQRSYASIVTRDSDGDYYQAPLKNTTLADGTVLKAKATWVNGQAAYPRKWLDWHKKDKEDPATAFRSGVNWREVRYADVLLMYAECLLQENDVDGAVEYVDMVRARAGVITLATYMAENANQMPKLDESLFMNDLTEYPMVAVTKENLMHHLQMVERPLELGFEGHRWNDLVRWGIVADVFDQRREDEKTLCFKLTGDENLGAPTSGETIAPFFLAKVRTDFLVKQQGYIPSVHNYLPVPSIEMQLNKMLYNPETETAE